MTKKSIREIAMAWREDKRPYVKQSTFAAYMLILENHLLPYFGENDALSEKAVQDFVLQKTQWWYECKIGKGHSYCAQNGDEVRVKHEWMNYSEWDIKYPTAETNKELEVLTVAHHKKILDYIRQNFTFRNLGIYISLSTGLRIGEVCALRWSDINVDSGTISVQRTIERIYIIEGEKETYRAGY